MMAIIQEAAKQDIFGDPIYGDRWVFPNKFGGEDVVADENLTMYLELVLGAKRALVLKNENGIFYETDAWTFPDDGYTVEEDHLEQYLEWAYGAQKEYV